jgi:hypothetical protein
MEKTYLTNKDLKGLTVNGWRCDHNVDGQGTVMWTCDKLFPSKQLKEINIWATPSYDQKGKVPIELTDSWGECVFIMDLQLDDSLPIADQRTLYVNAIKVAIATIPLYKKTLGIDKDKRNL